MLRLGVSRYRPLTRKTQEARTSPRRKGELLKQLKHGETLAGKIPPLQRKVNDIALDSIAAILFAILRNRAVTYSGKAKSHPIECRWANLDLNAVCVLSKKRFVVKFVCSIGLGLEAKL